MSDKQDAAGRFEAQMEADNRACLEKRRDTEPMFIILGRDPDAANVVRYWAERRRDAGDPEHAAKAFAVAELMAGYSGEADSAPPPEAYSQPASEPSSEPSSAMTPEWCINMAEREGDAEIGAGSDFPTEYGRLKAQKDAILTKRSRKAVGVIAEELRGCLNDPEGMAKQIIRALGEKP